MIAACRSLIGGLWAMAVFRTGHGVVLVRVSKVWDCFKVVCLCADLIRELLFVCIK